MDKETHRKTVQRFKRERITKVCCFICGEDNAAALELHHIEGRNNSDLQIALCKRCHAVITSEQNKVPTKARSISASTKQKLAFSAVTMGAFCELYGKKLKEHGFEVINHERDCSSRIHKKGKT
ncbi:MAG: hypothetical protein ABSE07_06330 [Methanoregula sp.]